MSHFTYLQTRFQNLFYLKKAFDKLTIPYQEENSGNESNQNLIIPQSNGYPIKFDWNREEYQLVVDLSFWDQPYPIESFLEKLTQEYAGELIRGESQKIGFESIKTQSNVDGSNTIILERYNTIKL